MITSSLPKTQSGIMALADAYLRERYRLKSLRKKPNDMNMFQWTRKCLCVTQKQMADILNVSVPSLKAYEYGSRNPGHDVWQHLSDVTHVSVADLLEINGERHQTENRRS